MGFSLVADSPNVHNHQEESHDGDIIIDSALEISNPEFASLGGEYLDWMDPEIDFLDNLQIDLADFMNPQTKKQYLPSGSLSLLDHSTPSRDPIVEAQHAISSPILSIPPLPTSTVRSLIQRPKLRTGEQRITNLILHTLKSYPLMMLGQSALPPFIHPHLISSDVGKTMEPLTNCSSLVHMISNRVHRNRKLFWKNVRSECERMCQEVRTLSLRCFQKETHRVSVSEIKQMGTTCCYASPFHLHSHKVGRRRDRR
jgi:hypothetical protein